MELRFGPALADGDRFVGLPLSGTITSHFGERDIAEHAAGHSGLDIAAVVGTLVRAPAPGLVVEATASAGVFGTYVTVRHGRGLTSLFAHLSRLDVAAGQRVGRGDVLGAVGVTGLTTGPHLHWGLALGGSPLVAGPHLRDPLSLLAAAPEAVDRERLLAAAGLGLLAALQAAGALIDSREAADFEGYPANSPEAAVLAVQRAADPLIALGLEWLRANQ